MENTKLIGISGPPCHIELTNYIDDWEHNPHIEGAMYMKSIQLYHRDTDALIGVYIFTMSRAFNDKIIYCESTFVILHSQEDRDKYIICRLEKEDFSNVDFDIGEETRIKNREIFQDTSWNWAYRKLFSWANRIYVAPENYIDTSNK